jgi:EAL domain-containing protein (putative c-di-GMP-specific phosphodiesterase class I)
MESPAVLFSVAQNNDLVEDLDRICKIKSLLNFQLNTTQAKREGRSISELKLFLNTEPQTFHDPYFTADKLEELINSHGIENSNLVLEITERSAISNYLEFRGILKAFRDKGFLIAIDDAGSGYSSLQAIVELEPDFVKIDMALIRDIDQDKIKQGLISALVKFSLENRIPMIAEGVETIEEYDQLVDMGVQYAQGFYFARPLPELLKSDNIVIV